MYAHVSDTIESVTLRIQIFFIKSMVVTIFYKNDKLDIIVIDLKILKQIEDEIAAKEVEKAVEKALKEN